MLQKVNVLITGYPGCGKSTLINRIIDQVLQRGMRVGGISTPEFRLNTGRRGGFLIRDIATGKEQTLAAIGLSSPVMVGRYGVNLNAIREVGVKAIDNAVVSAELVVIDEIGKMELAVEEFQQSVIKALNSPKVVLGTFGMKLQTPFLSGIKNRNDVMILVLTPEERSHIYQKVCTLLDL